MAVTQETKFKSSDGREFDSENEAQKHDELIVARREYEDALARVEQLVVETTRTADGHLCKLGIFTDYWYVNPGWHGMPTLRKVPYLGWHWHLNYHDDAVVIAAREVNSERASEYKISDLYRDKKKAIAAMIEAQQAWLAERQTEVNDNIEKFARGEDPTRS